MSSSNPPTDSPSSQEIDITVERANAVSFASTLLSFGGNLSKGIKDVIVNYLRKFQDNSNQSNTLQNTPNNLDIPPSQPSEPNSQSLSPPNEETQENYTSNVSPEDTIPQTNPTEKSISPNEQNQRDSNEETSNLSQAIDAISRFSRYIAHSLPSFDIRSHLSSIIDYMVPDFSPDVSYFDSFDEDFFGSSRGGTKFLNKYSKEDCTQIIQESSLSTKLSQLNLNDWYIELDLSDSFSHSAYLRSKSFPTKTDYIGFLIVQNGPFKLLVPNPTDSPGKKLIYKKFGESLNLLNIRWFSLQNPRAAFPPMKPRLPGQRYPGTGMARDALGIFVRLGLKAGKDGIINCPEHFHNAYLYSGFFFLNPEEQGAFNRLKKDLDKDIKEKSLAAVSWAIYLGFLRSGINDEEGETPNTGNVVNWQLHEQVLPLSLKVKLYFESREYKALEQKAERESGPFSIMWNEAEKYCLINIIKGSASDPGNK